MPSISQPPLDTRRQEEDDPPETPEELIRRVTDRVWQMLRADLRRDQERRGKRFVGE